MLYLNLKMVIMFWEVSSRALEHRLVDLDDLDSRDGGYRIPIPWTVVGKVTAREMLGT